MLHLPKLPPPHIATGSTHTVCGIDLYGDSTSGWQTASKGALIMEAAAGTAVCDTCLESARRADRRVLGEADHA